MEGEINFYSENDFILEKEPNFKEWLLRVIQSEGKEVGSMNIVFCDDEYLLLINQEYLNHDTYTDVIGFSFSELGVLSGDIFISTQRVLDNSKTYGVDFEEELLRVMAHGVLHFCGYDDGNAQAQELMRGKEEDKIGMFHVEQ